jgi:FeS assembly protein IscX
MAETFHWLDVQRIGEELYDAHPEVDPLKVTFPDLRRLVVELPGFEEQEGHPVNERILEAIQMAWYEERREDAEEDA